MRPSCLLLLAACCLTVNVQAEERPVSFELDVLPIFSARGCNAGACHGKARGQNGFALSLLAFDPDSDYAALTQEARGRRLFPAAPERSLLLSKPSGQSPHGGGVRLELGSDDYQTVLDWIEQGTQRSLPDEPQLQNVTITPTEASLAPGAEQAIRVTAHYSDGTQRDVTSRSDFQSNSDAIAGASESGVVTAGPLPGETAVMVRYMNNIALCNVMIPFPGTAPAELYAGLPRQNFIDELVWKKLQTLGLTPSEPASDAKFVRRVYLDIIGRLPTPDETKNFLVDSEPNKRAVLIDALLERPEYVDFWAQKWADILRPNPYRVGIKATLNYDNWIREQFRREVPYDQFVRDLVTAQGSTWRNGAVTLFRDRRTPDEVAPMISQLFLGVRLECAKCHHHPFEKWAQEDFYRFAAYFARVGHKGTGLSPPISGGEENVYAAVKGEVTHPLTGEVLEPRPLYGTAPAVEEDGDWRVALAEWMTSDENEYFAQVQANRTWADLMGRGIVEPVDDLRTTNPPTNGPLLEALADHFRQQKYDQKALIRAICISYVYGLSAMPGERNVADTLNYSRHYRVRLGAETLIDAIDDITETETRYSAMPPASRSVQIWTNRVESISLDTFGRPDPNQDPPCERSPESTVAQTLHLMNAPQLHAKITAKDGRAARLAKSDLTDDEIITELYLLTYCRFPDQADLEACRGYFQGVERRQAVEDLLWALLNTPEFVYKD
ncbi:DUF1549 domain-containing protein [Lignipirellula cremea]|uniref:Bacterial Ig-like domain (Group 2) n=1 Tax=Lignipirellula cremea TaxID=2528010 RepID=A0A518DRZ4_9BACT|nr:DUF1549 domain-containing protein [Lignipirellula cremea]QDU94615.1 hypothetical protein Pla8534_24080 [Lignipirellula cremea]